MKRREQQNEVGRKAAKLLAVLAILTCWLALPEPGLAGPLPGEVIIEIPVGTIEIGELGNDEAPGPNPNLAMVTVPIGGPGDIFKLFPWAPGASPTATEVFVEETIVNLLSGLSIISHHMELGWWVGGAFQPSIPGDDLDFDWGPPPVPGPARTPPAMGTHLTGTIDDFTDEDLLSFFGPPNLPPGASATLQFSVDVPDMGPPGSTPTHWVIRESAVVPEPATLGLVGSALLVLTILRWRLRCAA
jgi:hypothetical protein